jgi:23S rRNA (cytidine1920-2'-O)/16S rRNA (cytidine1409-2'-O)-methyltransferase
LPPSRLDSYLVAVGRFESRARALAAIRAGLVRINGATATKASLQVRDGAEVEVLCDVHDYVSRGGVKLARAIAAFAIDPADRICLDLGASTGGFTEVLLRGGARKVYAVDVGVGQLHPRIAADPRVINLEGLHARNLSAAHIAEAPAMIVCDVSFISIMKALPTALALAAPSAQLAALVKPQFELGPERIGRGGIVRATAPEIAGLLASIGDWLAASGWALIGIGPSPVAGGDGNREYLIGAARDP